MLSVVVVVLLLGGALASLLLAWLGWSPWVLSWFSLLLLCVWVSWSLLGLRLLALPAAFALCVGGVVATASATPLEKHFQKIFVH